MPIGYPEGMVLYLYGRERSPVEVLRRLDPAPTRPGCFNYQVKHLNRDQPMTWYLPWSQAPPTYE